MSELTTIKDLLEDEIKDLYSAENQLTKAIPKMAKGSNNKELASAFEAHLKEPRARSLASRKLPNYCTPPRQEKSVAGWRESLRKAPKP